MKGWAWLRLSRLLNSHIGTALLWTLLVIGSAIAVNSAGIHLLGNIDNWQRWLRAHAGHFFVWRLCLYGATAYAWRQARRPLGQRESGAEASKRLRVTGIAALLVALLQEGSQLLQSG